MATELGLLATARVARFYGARLHWVSREFDEATTELSQLQADADAAGDGATWMASTRLLAETSLFIGRPAEAEPFLDAAIERSQMSGERWSRTELWAYKAEARARQGDVAGGEAALAESAATLRAIDYAANGAYQHSLGLIRELQGRYEDAEQAYRLQLEIVEQSDNWFWQLAALDLAEFLIARGRLAEAVPLVTRVATDATQMKLDQPRLERLQEALKTAGVSSPQPA
jgi:ATP/maltotriose-dependent transcriptional regulator MalT